MIEKYTWRLDAALVKDIASIASDDQCTVTKTVEDALKFYRDKRYMDAKATFLTPDILNAMQSVADMLEHRINNRSNQLISSMAIQQFIMVRVLADSLEVSPDALELYRAQAAEFLRANNRVLNLKEVIE